MQKSRKSVISNHDDDVDVWRSVFNTSKSETATFGAKTRQKPPQFFSLKTATILAQTATILEISDFFP